MSWYHDFDGGRSFYTALGHTDESYTEDNFTKHLLGGIQYAIGKNQVLNYSKAKSQIPLKLTGLSRKCSRWENFTNRRR
jgi:type 1 glutamine amidotransferase